jgi:hypothetical protein
MHVSIKTTRGSVETMTCPAEWFSDEKYGQQPE